MSLTKEGETSIKNLVGQDKISIVPKENFNCTKRKEIYYGY